MVPECCKGCKFENWPGKSYETDRHGNIWVIKCRGNACANWPQGTPMNLTAFECHPTSLKGQQDIFDIYGGKCHV